MVEKNRSNIYHEVIYKARAQKLYLDVDCKGSFLGEIRLEFARFKEILEETLLEVVNEFFGDQLKKKLKGDDLFIADSSGEVGADFKYSYHVLVNPNILCVENGRVNRFVAQHVKDRMERVHQRSGEVIDMGVYSDRHCLRVPLTQKERRTLHLPAKFKRYTVRKQLFGLSLVTWVDESF